MSNGNWVQTFTSKAVHPFDIKIDEIDIEDIAQSLALCCRFNGHCRGFYSIANHSMRVAELLPNPLKIWGLLHDAAETYLSDIPRPTKQHLYHHVGECIHISDVENKILEAIAKKFNLVWPVPSEVKEADNIMLATEKRDLMGKPPQSWGKLPKPLDKKIILWENWHKDKVLFLECFEKYMERREIPDYERR